MFLDYTLRNTEVGSLGSLITASQIHEKVKVCVYMFVRSSVGDENSLS